MNEIVVTNRTDDIHACLKDHPEVWGCGRTSLEAIGSLISVHPAVFGIKINWELTDHGR